MGAASGSVDLLPDTSGSEVNCVASSPPSRKHVRGIEEILFGEAGIETVFFTGVGMANVGLGGVGIGVGFVGV